MPQSQTIPQRILAQIISYGGMALGALFAAAAIRIFLIPNELIDGGVIGISLILGRLYGTEYLPLYLFFLNIPFIFLAWRHIRRSFVLHMFFATVFFAVALKALESVPMFHADPLEAIVIGGAMLGAGAGFIIRHGGCTDGTEILAILINRRKGFTVGQVIFFINIFIFGAYGWIFLDWHIALRSLMTYVVAFKTMDIVIAGLEELKSVLILCSKPDKLSKVITSELGLGHTFLKGKGGYTGEDRDILFLVVERLDLAELKEIVLREDPTAFMAIETLHEAVYGRAAKVALRRKTRRSFAKSLLS